MLNLIVAAAFAAGAYAPATESTAQNQAEKSERKICEVYQETGSRLGKKRICLTAEQWQERRRSNRGEVERAQQNVGQATAQ